ncbi:MAG: CHASE2 domain-containing protein, partial [Burkholderiales bacterium]|nr:CHASE2 domain-containing protein [Burkholderiales bacterium]
MTARGGWSLHVLLAVGAAVLVFALALAFPFTALDRLGYDLGMRLSSRTPAPEIVVVAIDEPTIAQLGPGGWSRSIDAQIIDSLSAAGAKVIGYAGFFPDAAADPAAEQVNRLDAVFRSLDA